MRRQSLVYLTAFAFLCIQCAPGNGKAHQARTHVSPDALRAAGQSPVNSNPSANGNQPVQDSDISMIKDKPAVKKDVSAEDMNQFLKDRSDADNQNRKLIGDLPAGTYTLKEVITNFEVIDSSLSSVATSANGQLNAQTKSMNYEEVEDLTVNAIHLDTKMQFTFALKSTQISDTKTRPWTNKVPKRPFNVETSFQINPVQGANPVHANTMAMVIHGFANGQPQTLTGQTQEKFTGIVNSLFAKQVSNKAYKGIYSISQPNSVFLSLVSPTELHVTLEITESAKYAATRRLYLTYEIAPADPSKVTPPSDDPSKATQLSTLPPEQAAAAQKAADDEAAKKAADEAAAKEKAAADAKSDDDSK
jgi:hypothetical protein